MPQAQSITELRTRRDNLRGMLTVARKARQMWRERYEDEKERSSLLQAQLDELREHVAEIQQQEIERLQRESRQNGWKAYQAKYGASDNGN